MTARAASRQPAPPQGDVRTPDSAPHEIRSNPGPARPTRVCPRCVQQLIHVGSAFAASRRRDTAGRRVLTVLLEAGVGFHKSCCTTPGYRPRTLREVRQRIAYAEATGEPLARALIRPELP